MKSLRYSLFTVVLIALVAVSCKKDDDSSEPTPTGKITSRFFYNAFIDGVEVLLQDGVNFYGNGASSSGGKSGASNKYVLAEQTAFATYNADEEGFFGLIGIFGNSYPSVEEKKTIFKTGSFTYGLESTELAGAIVEYVDTNGDYWTSDYPGGSQLGSSFKIIDVNDDNTNSEFHLIITVEFNCTLYDENGNSKKLTGGKGRGRFIF